MVQDRKKTSEDRIKTGQKWNEDGKRKDKEKIS